MYSSLADAGVTLPDRVAQTYSVADDGERVMYLGASDELTLVDMVAMVLGEITPVDCDLFGTRAAFQAYNDLAYWFGRELGQSVHDPTVSPELAGDDRTAALDVVRERVATLSLCTP